MKIVYRRLRLFAIAVCALLATAARADTVTATAGGLGVSPGPAIVDPIRNRVYYGDDGVKVLDAGNVLSDLGVPGRVLAYDAMFDKLVVDDNTTSNTQIRIVDPDTLTTSTLAVPAGNHRIGANAARNELYVYSSVSGQGTLTTVDMATLSTTAVAVPGTAMPQMAVNEVTGEIYLGGAPPHAYNPATGSMTTIGMQFSQRIVVNPVTNRVYITGVNGSGQSRLMEVDGPTKAVTSFGTYSPQLAVNPVTNKVYVALDGSILIYDGATRSLDATVPVTSGSPIEIAVNPSTNKIYATAYPPVPNAPSSDSLTMLDGATNIATLLATLPGRAGGLTLNPVTNRIYAWYSCQFLTCSAEMTVVDGNGSTAQGVAPTTTISPFSGNVSATTTPLLTFTPSAGLAGMTASAVFYQLDGVDGRWRRASATGGGQFSATPAALTPGSHTVYAFAADRGLQPSNPGTGSGMPVRIGAIGSYTFAVSDPCATGQCADLAVGRIDPGGALAGKDAIFELSATNNGPATATGVSITHVVPISAAVIWSSPGCAASMVTAPGGTFTNVTCALGSLANGATGQATIVVRPLGSGSLSTTSSVQSSVLDPRSGNDSITGVLPVGAPPLAKVIPRYRLYSPVSLEHHFTMDANEYAVLGASGAWVQEGTVGKVLDNPGFFNGVQAVPYYRLYNTVTRWHHWTTDPNEYYTLRTFPGWNAEDVAGWILPLSTVGTTQLYRLTYPFIGGLHHWTIDTNEYNTLISQYGWVGEGGSGFVIQ